MKKRELVGVLLAVIGVICFSAKAVFVKLAYQYGIDTVSLLLLRMGFALPFYMVILTINKIKDPKPIPFKTFMLVVFLGFIGYYLASFFDFKGLNYITASLERLILFVYPTFVVLLSAIFLKTKLQAKSWVAILITYIGVAVVFVPGFFVSEQEAVNPLGVGLIVLSALTYASYLVGSQHVISTLGTVVFTSLAMLVSVVCVLVHFGTTIDDFSTILDYPKEVYFLGLAMAFVSTVIPSFLISEGINRLGASRVAIIGSLGPVSTIVLSLLFLGEFITAYQVFGAVIIIGGVVWLNLKKGKK